MTVKFSDFDDSLEFREEVEHFMYGCTPQERGASLQSALKARNLPAIEVHFCVMGMQHGFDLVRDDYLDLTNQWLDANPDFDEPYDFITSVMAVALD